MGKEKKKTAQKKQKNKKINLTILYGHLIHKLPHRIYSRLLGLECFTLNKLLQSIPQATGNPYANIEEMRKAIDIQQNKSSCQKLQQQILTAQNPEEQCQINFQWNLQDQISSPKLNLPVGFEEIQLMRQKQISIDFFQ